MWWWKSYMQFSAHQSESYDAWLHNAFIAKATDIMWPLFVEKMVRERVKKNGNMGIFYKTFKFLYIFCIFFERKERENAWITEERRSTAVRPLVELLCHNPDWKTINPDWRTHNPDWRTHNPDWSNLNPDYRNPRHSVVESKVYLNECQSQLRKFDIKTAKNLESIYESPKESDIEKGSKMSKREYNFGLIIASSKGQHSRLLWF